MTANEAAIRKAYRAAEDQDVAGWVNCFTEDGTSTDESINVTGDVFPLRNGKIQSFNCYPSGTVIQKQLGLKEPS